VHSPEKYPKNDTGFKMYRCGKYPYPSHFGFVVKMPFFPNPVKIPV